jgi:hypothetical protein
MEPLTASELSITIKVEDVASEDDGALDRNPHCPKHVKDGIGFLETHLAEKGYEDVHSTLVKNPRMTERGVLYAEGTFAGPSPNDGDRRDPEDFSDDYRFLVLADENHEDLYLIEVYFSTRKLATFEIADTGLKLISGEIAHI